MNDKQKDYFDIKKLFKVMDANGWTMGKNFMKFWANGSAKFAVIGSGKSKSTIGANLNQGSIKNISKSTSFNTSQSTLSI
jgi:hypothetical protein